MPTTNEQIKPTFRIHSILILLFFYSGIAISQTPTISSQKTIGGSQLDQGYGFIESSNGDFIFCALSASDSTNEKSDPNWGVFDFWIYRMTPSGNLVWQKTYGGTAADIPRTIIETDDGGVLIIGFSNSPISGNKSSVNYGGYDVWAIKLNNMGQLIWQNTYGGTSDETSSCATKGDNGTFYIGSSSTSIISGNKTVNTKGGYDYWILHIDSNGSIIKQAGFGGSSDESLKSIHLMPEGKILLSGISSSNVSGDKTENSFGSSDFWLVKLDSNLNIIQSMTIGGDGDETNGASIVTDNNEILIFGSSNSGVTGNKTAINYGGSDYWLVKLDNQMTIIWDKTFG